MQFAERLRNAHAHPPEENFLFESTRKRDAYRTCERVDSRFIAGILRDLFVEYLRYARGEGQIVPVRKCRIKSAIKARTNEYNVLPFLLPQFLHVALVLFLEIKAPPSEPVCFRESSTAIFQFAVFIARFFHIEY